MNDNIIKLTDNELVFLRDDLRELLEIRGQCVEYNGLFGLHTKYNEKTKSILDYLNRLIVAKGLTNLDYYNFINGKDE